MKKRDMTGLAQGTPENPQLGDIRMGRDIGRKCSHSFIWRACERCGKQSWVGLRNGQPTSLGCGPCSNTKRRPFPQGSLEAPVEGDIRKGIEIGKKAKMLHIWRICPSCGNGRWVQKGRKETLCCACALASRERILKLRITREKKRLQRIVPQPKGTIDKPEPGDIRNACELGKHGHSFLMWHLCVLCGNGRWVILYRDGVRHTHCRKCGVISNKRLKATQALVGPRSPYWKGGRLVNKHGYVSLWVSPDDFFHGMCPKGKNHCLEHRLIMAKTLGRLLHSWEEVHHKDLDPANNNPKNLELKMKGHGTGTTSKVQLVSKLHESKATVKELNAQVKKLTAHVKQLEVRVTMLEADNVLLKEGVRL